ncbi:rap1 GTPase-activating protein 1-like isoform X2 [Xenia sp. Carnegie-2017]|uniref:rap1 GTPase-activating protein 1-like isoform X2 n=1 Tax=Xenia sp. Carnegie-2017 TaxID=2897299 RepID=UPI001F043637|nr:rap1 GTPase-activating protein 1-like isoform X2 [Xenia sp. Carnegie-2017]
MDQSGHEDTVLVAKKKDPIHEVLNAGSPYPLVVLPVSGDYWQEGTNHICDKDKRGKVIIKKIDESKIVIEDDLEYSAYKNFFKNQEHYNYVTECCLGSLLLSLKFEENGVSSGEEKEEVVRVILRSSDRMEQRTIPMKNFSSSCVGPKDILKQFMPDLLEDFNDLNFQPILYPKASSLIMRFDEHGHAEKFKVGVVYQRPRQINESEFFNNKSCSKAMYDFLQILGDEIELFGFKGYNGGLDTKNHQTGRKSVYTKYKGREIMFHVSTMLPHTSGDVQQLQRKRHIGNDIITFVFQDENTPFCPSSIRSSFLHIFFVVQVVEPYTNNTRYKITVTAKEDVPKFGPSLPNPAVFSKNDPHLKDFLLTKLLNAELAAYKAKQFSTLMERTRKMLFEDLISTLTKKTQEILSPGAESAGGGNVSRGRLLHSLRNAFRSESVRSDTIDRSGRECLTRSKSMENIVHPDDIDKTLVKKKKNQFKRYSVSGDKTRKPFRPKNFKSMFHSSSQTDGREITTSEENYGDVSPTFDPHDDSPSGSFHTLDAVLDKPTSPLLLTSPESGDNTEPQLLYGKMQTEETNKKKILNGYMSTPRAHRETLSREKNSPSMIRKPLIKSSSAESTPFHNRVSKVDINDESLMRQLRGDLYKLSKEKDRLQHDNENLREDMKRIKEAMTKQAKDLCESQLQLNRLLVNSRLPDLPSSSV